MMPHKKYTMTYTPVSVIPQNLFGYVRMIVLRNPIMWACMILMDIIHGVRYALSFLCVGIIIDLLIAQGGDVVITNDMMFYIALIFIILFVGELAHAIPHYFYFDWIRDTDPKLRADLLSYTLGHSYTYFQNRFAGSLARKITQGVDKVSDMAETVRWQILLTLVSMVTSGIVLLTVSWLYGLLIIVFIALVILPVFLKLQKISKKSQIYADVRSKLSGQIVDTLTNVAAVKSFAHEKHELAQHARVSEEEMKSWHKMLRVFLLLDNYRRFTLVLFGGGLMAACVYGWKHGIVTPGEIATIMGVTFAMTGNVWTMSFGIINLTEQLWTIKDSLSTLIVPIGVKDKPDATALKVTKGRIHFKAIDFEYKDQPVFEKLELDIKPGERIGLIGPSGAGKSTLVNLVQRFFDVKAGALLIDGQDVRDITQDSLRKNIAFIPQDTSLFHRSLMENIRYGKLDAHDDEVCEAARKAYAESFISKMPEKYETIVGERGVKLSGGQRQRIAIARAILKDAPILILDEATSALDSESEKCIQDSLKELMKGKTVIAVAHRLSTISHLDRLIVMDDGRIVEQGKHDDLLSKNGLYAKLWGMQSGGFLGD